MRLKLICVLLLGISFTPAAQTLKTKTIGNESFIDFSYEQLIQTFNMPMAELEKELIELGFEKTIEEQKDPIYMKGETENYIQAILKDKTGLLIVDWVDFTGKNKMFEEIETRIKKGYFETRNGISYYYYDKYVFGIMSASDDEFYSFKILMKLKKA